MVNTSVPQASPTQNPFPAWYLREGTINAAEDAIERGSESCERWEWGCAWLVVLSIVAEFVLAIIHPSLWNRIGSPALPAPATIDPLVFGEIGIDAELIPDRIHIVIGDRL